MCSTKNKHEKSKGREKKRERENNLGKRDSDREIKTEETHWGF